MSVVHSELLSWLQEDFLSLVPVNSAHSSQNVKIVLSLTQGTSVCTEQWINLGGIIHTIVFVLRCYHKMKIAGLISKEYKIVCTFYFIEYVVILLVQLQEITVRHFVFWKTKSLQIIFFSNIRHEYKRKICSDTVYFVYCPENDLEKDRFQNRFLHLAGNHY